MAFSRAKWMSRRGFLGSLTATALPAELHWLGIAEAGTLIRARKLSPVELTRHTLARIERLNPGLNAFITVTAEQAMADARRLENQKWRGPLHGIPVALKDLYDTRGVRTTAGSEHFAARAPEADAEVVARLRAAGAVIVGKANMDEFAYNYTGETSYFGTARNPWDRERSPGGSSGGSAVAVAAGMCMAALGSDTGGSIRLPAALCGVCGLKPSYGRLSTRGVLPLAWTLDTVGPMARSARDTGLVFAAMGGGEREAGPARRFGIPRAPFYEGMDGETAALLEAALRRFAGAREVAFPRIRAAAGAPELSHAYGTVIYAEAYTYHRERMETAKQRFHAGTRNTIALGATVTAAEYIAARRELEDWRARADELFDGVDLLLTPTAPGPAFPLGAPGGLIYLRNTSLWNLFGLPTISVPCGFTKTGLPVGLQITGRAGADWAVLEAAARLEADNGVPLRHPSE